VPFLNLNYVSPQALLVDSATPSHNHVQTLSELCPDQPVRELPSAAYNAWHMCDSLVV